MMFLGMAKGLAGTNAKETAEAAGTEKN